MKTFEKVLKRIFLLLIFAGLIFMLVTYYSFIFSRTVIGRIDNVARLTGVTAMFGGNKSLTDGQLHSFSISIRQPDGEMITSTSEDGQWAIARVGSCVKAKYYPHPPWNLKLAGTYYNARLVSMADCESKAARAIGIDPEVFRNVPIIPGDGPKTPQNVPVEEHSMPESMAPAAPAESGGTAE